MKKLFSLVLFVIVILCGTVPAKTSSSLSQDYLHKLITEAELQRLDTKSDTNHRVHNRAPGDPLPSIDENKEVASGSAQSPSRKANKVPAIVGSPGRKRLSSDDDSSNSAPLSPGKRTKSALGGSPGRKRPSTDEDSNDSPPQSPSKLTRKYAFIWRHGRKRYGPKRPSTDEDSSNSAPNSPAGKSPSIGSPGSRKRPSSDEDSNISPPNSPPKRTKSSFIRAQGKKRLSSDEDSNSPPNSPGRKSIGSPGRKRPSSGEDSPPASPQRQPAKKLKPPFIRRLSDLSLNVRDSALDLSQKAASSVSNKFRKAASHVLNNTRARRQRKDSIANRFWGLVNQVMFTQREQREIRKKNLLVHRCKAGQFSERKAHSLYQQVDPQIIELLNSVNLKPQNSFEIREESFVASAGNRQKCVEVNLRTGLKDYVIQIQVNQREEANPEAPVHVHPCELRVSKSRKPDKVAKEFKFKVARVYCKSLYPSPILNMNMVH